MRIPKDPIKAARAKEMAYSHNMKNKLMKRYGMTLGDFDALMSQQNGVCAICGQSENFHYKRRLSVDHDHATGTVRGLLCHHCNTAIGKFGDSPLRLEAAAKYLRDSGIN